MSPKKDIDGHRITAEFRGRNTTAVGFAASSPFLAIVAGESSKLNWALCCPGSRYRLTPAGSKVAVSIAHTVQLIPGLGLSAFPP